MNIKGAVISLAAVGLAAGGGYFIYRSQFAALYAPAPPPKPVVVERPAPPKPAVPSFDLDHSDDPLREKAKALSASEAVSGWFANENLLRRLAAALAIIADGNSPRDSLNFLAPAKKFSVLKKKGRLYVSPKSYARYDALAEGIASLDAAGTAKLFKEIRPVFQKAFEELGAPSRDCEDVLLKAISVLLDTPVVVGNIRLKPKVVSYAMADERLEKLSSAQKHLLRMGPENTVKIQAKLREIALALGVSEARLPKTETYNPAAN